MIEQTYPSGRKVKNVLDDDGMLSMIQSKKNENAGYWNYAKNFTYTSSGAVESMQLGNGKWESTIFNSRLQPTQIALGTIQNGTDKLKLNFDYNTVGQNDNNGNVLKQTIKVPDTLSATGFEAIQTYNYDELNRLKSAEEKIANVTSWKQTYTFDRYGNRRFDEANTDTLQGGCATAVCNPTIDPATNKLIGYTFDNSGNTKVDANGQTFTYDAENKQILVKDSSSNTVGEYFYDGDGKRIKKVVPNTGETTIFVYDASGKMVAEYSTNVEPTATAKVSYLTSDHLGSPRITTDADGDVYTRRDFMPFGEEIDVNDTPERTATLNYASDEIRQKFTTYERDNETELDFAEARYYNKIQGRFITTDPIYITDDRLLDPQRINTYIYVRNNPLRYTDPSGLDIEVRGSEKNWTVEKIKEDVSFAKFIGVNDQSKLAISNGVGGFFDPNNKADKAVLDVMAKGLKDDKDIELFKAIIDPNNHAVLEATKDDDTVDIGENKSPGNNAVDRSEAEKAEKASKGGITSAEIVKHEAMEAYLTAKTGKPIVGQNSDKSPHDNNPYTGLFGVPDDKDPSKTYVLASRGNTVFETKKTFNGTNRTTVNGVFRNGKLTKIKQRN